MFNNGASTPPKRRANGGAVDGGSNDTVFLNKTDPCRMDYKSFSRTTFQPVVQSAELPFINVYS